MNAPSPHEHGPVLARWARERLREELGGPRATPPTGAWCDAKGATFVTLRWPDHRLQGCIGSLEARRPIAIDAARNAIAAALHDRRSIPICLDDVDHLDLELSILSPQQPIAFTDEASALAAIRPGTDGIVFQCGDHEATFLPSMWSELPDVKTFMGELKRKAGLPWDFWADGVRLWRYTVDKYVDPHRARGVVS